MNILTHLINRETELDRKRTVSLARQQWAAVIELEAKLSECKRLRNWLAENAEAETIKPAV